MVTKAEYDRDYRKEGIIGKRGLVEGEDYTKRKCMCCGHTFKSEGIHNRMCGWCRTKTDGMI